MNVMVLYLSTKFRTIPFFIVLLGTLQSDFLFVVRNSIALQRRHAFHFLIVLILCLWICLQTVLSVKKVQDNHLQFDHVAQALLF